MYNKNFFKTFLENNIPINIIANLILLLENRRSVFQIEPDVFENTQQGIYFLNFAKNSNIDIITYKGDEFINSFSIIVLEENKHKLNGNMELLME